MQRKLRRGVKCVFVGEDLLEAYANVADLNVSYTQVEDHTTCIDIPHELSVGRARMQLQIAPSVPYVIAGAIGTIEAEEDETVLHHFLSFKEDA